MGYHGDNNHEVKGINEQISNLHTTIFGRFHLQECEEAKKYGDFLDSKKDDNLTYDDYQTLKEKEYGYQTLNQISGWNLSKRVSLPDLKEKERKGVVKTLSVMSRSEKEKEEIIGGKVNDLIIFLTPRGTPITKQNLPELLKKEQKPGFFYTMSGSKDAATHEKIIASFFIWRVLQKQQSWNHNIYLLENNKDNLVGKHLPTRGNSAAVAWYLSLLSVYYQKPISKEVAATAAIDVGKLSKIWCVQCFQEKWLAKNMEENFSKNKIIPISGLEYKASATVQDGAKKLILSTEQKEDYEKNVSPEIKEKLKVYYVKDVEELEELFWVGEFS